MTHWVMLLVFCTLHLSWICHTSFQFDESEEEVDEVVNQVLDGIGIDLASMVSTAYELALPTCSLHIVLCPI